MSKKITGLLLLSLLLASLFGGNVVLPIGELKAADVYAEESRTPNTRAVEISPSSKKIIIDPGEIRTDSFNITNRGTAVQTYNISVAPYQVSDENYTPIFEGMETAIRSQIARWISFEAESYTLAPEETAQVNFTVNAPENAAGGGQYAAIFVSSKSESNSTINDVGRVGLLVYATVRGDISESGEVIGHSIRSPVFDKNISISTIVKNNGNTDFTVHQTLSVKSVFNDREVYMNKQGFAVLPETTRLISMEWVETPYVGLFKVSSTVDAIYTDKTSEQLGTWTRTVLVLPLFMFIILLIILLIFMAAAVLKIMQIVGRKRV